MTRPINLRTDVDVCLLVADALTHRQNGKRHNKRRFSSEPLHRILRGRAPVKCDEGIAVILSLSARQERPADGQQKNCASCRKSRTNILVFGRFTWPSYTSPMRWQENHQRRKERSDDIQVLFRSRDKFRQNRSLNSSGVAALSASNSLFKQLCKQSAARYFIRKLFSQRAENAACAIAWDWS